MALAREILARYAELTTGPRIAFFESLAAQLRPRPRAARRRDRRPGAPTPTDATAAAVHRAAEPRRQELLRRLNLAPGGTAALVRMREQLLDALAHRDDLAAVDRDFVHMFSSWFNRGFLVLRRIDWSTPASILERIIRYEAVHRIHDWDDLRRAHRSARPALLRLLPSGAGRRSADLRRGRAHPRDPGRDRSDPRRASASRSSSAAPTTAVFYSISNCQRGLAGVSFGNFLIKQVVEEIAREYPKLTRFVTLSPVPGFADWLAPRARGGDVEGAQAGGPRRARRSSRPPGWWQTAMPRAAQGPAVARGGLVFPARQDRAAARRSIRSRASISATARGSSGSTGSPTPPSAALRSRTA